MTKQTPEERAIARTREYYGFDVNDNSKMNTTQEDAKRYRLYRKGYDDVQIAEQCGVSRQAIAHWRMKKGLPANGQIKVKSVKKELIEQIHQRARAKINLTSVPVDDLRKLLRALERNEG